MTATGGVDSAQLRAILTAATRHAMIATDLEGKVLFLNEAAELLFGCTAEQVVGQDSPAVLHDPAEMGAAAAELGIEPGLSLLVWDSTLEGPRRRWTYRRTDATTFPAEVTVSPIQDADGSPTGYLTVVQDVSAQVQTERARSDIEERLKLLIEHSKDYAIFVLDPDGTITTWNDGAQRTYGYSAQEAIGRHFSTFSTPEDLERGHPQHELTVAEWEGVFREEGWRVRKDGSRFWALATITALRAPDGTLRGFGKVIRDLTERRLAEEKLQASRALSQLLSDASSEAIILMEGGGTILEVNQTTAQMFGYASTSEMVGLNGTDLVQPEDREKVRRRWATQALTPVEIRARRKDGSDLWTLITARELEQEGQRRRAALVHDLTEVRRMTANLARVEERFQMLVDTSPVGIFETDTEGVRTFVNARWREIFGVGDEPAVGVDLLGRIEDSAREQVAADWAACLRTGEAFDALVPLSAGEGGSLWVQVRVRARRDSQGAISGWTGTVEDVTERIAVERSLASHARELERSNNDLDEFASAASHDLKSPLLSIGSFARLLAVEENLSEDGQEAVRFITQGVDRLAAVIDDLLAYAQVGRAGPAQPVDTQAVLDDVLMALREPIADAEAVIESDPLPPVLADRTQVAQLLQNLISNAVKFRGEQAPVVQIRATAGADEHTFVIEDNGIGIDPAYREKVFGMFQRLHSRRDYPGTGVGLALCRRVVERFGGSIKIVDVAHGTAIHFTLPAVPPEATLSP